MKKCICQNISLNEASKLFKDKSVTIIDVRDRNEFIKGNIKNSINIPVSNLKRDIKNFVRNTNQPILVYCSTGVRSLAACQILANMGYEMVYNISNGIDL